MIPHKIANYLQEEKKTTEVMSKKVGMLPTAQGNVSSA